MSDKLFFNENLIFKIKGLDTNKEVLSFVADKLYKEDCVNDEYKDAILKREESFPTGLFTGAINIAIPHADCAYVKKAALAIGVLDKPVEFQSMDDPDKSIGVSLVIMLALSEPHGHLEMLQKVVELIKNQDDLKEIVESEDTKKVFDLISRYLL